MMENMEVLGVDPQDEVESDNKPRGSPSQNPPQPVSGVGSKKNVASQNPAYPAIMPAPQSPTATDEADPSSQSKSTPPLPQNSGSQIPSSEAQSSGTTATVNKPQRNRKGLTPEQKEKLQAIQQEHETIRTERVAILSEKLLQKISVWIETDRNPSVTDAFKKKIQVC
jgi:hypothetical protein